MEEVKIMGKIAAEKINKEKIQKIKETTI